MASKAEWVDKIKSWIPAWFFTETTVENSVIQALAKVLSDADAAMTDQVAQTFVETAIGGFLAMHGAERGVSRFDGEFTSEFRKRVRAAAVKSNANAPALIDLLNKIVIRGKATIKEDFEVGAFVSRATFLNRGDISVSPITNTFTVVVDRQVHEPLSFLNRSSFVGEILVGQNQSNTRVFELLIKTINENKAFGTFFRIVERTQ